jgi:hypothetical protein
MDAPDVWVAKDDGSEMIRAREIAAVSTTTAMSRRGWRAAMPRW